MRLAACALSAVLLSGCSWLGLGGQSNGFGSSGGAYGSSCAPVQSGTYGQYGQAASYGGSYGYDAGCAGGSYGVAQGYGDGYGAGAGFGGAGFGPGAGAAGFGGAGFGPGAGFGGAGFGPGAGAAGFGGAGFGPGAGFGGAGFGPGAGAAGFGGAGFGPGAGFGGAGFGAGAAGFGGAGGFGPGAVGPGLAAQGIGGGFGGNTGFGNGGVTTFGAGAPFGAAGFGANGGQFVNGVQNVVGAPIFVPQPFAAPFGVPQLRGVGAALPFGFEVFGGTEFDIDGVAKNGRERSPSDPGNGGASTGVAGEFDDIDFSDAFSDGYTLGGAATYDVSRNTTLLASAAFSEKNGRTLDTGSFQSGSFGATPPTLANFTPTTGAVDRDLEGTFSDLRQYTFEAGVRQYVGNGLGLRPYVGATGGFTYNNDVDLTQNYTDTGQVFSPRSEFIDSGWRPTASGLVGAELSVGPRAAIGVETGIRWRDGLKGDQVNNDDRFSIPLNLRGRLAF